VIKLGKNADRLVDLPGHELESLRKQAANRSALFLHQVFDLLFREEGNVRFTAQPRLVLEMMFLRLAQIQPALSIDELIAKLDRLRPEVAGAPPEGGGKAPGGGQSGPAPETGTGQGAGGLLSPADSGPETNFDAGGPDRLWERLLDMISAAHPALGTSLKQGGRVSRLGAHAVEIELQGNGFSRNLVKRRKNREILRQKLCELLGRPVDVSVAAVSDRNAPKARKRQEAEELKKAALRHPLVADAVEIFDGTIVNVELFQEVNE
jgi:DNA polymerase-3 subunit gamma/tau